MLRMTEQKARTTLMVLQNSNISPASSLWISLTGERNKHIYYLTTVISVGRGYNIYTTKPSAH